MFLAGLAVSLLAMVTTGCGPTTYRFHGQGPAVSVDAKLEVSPIEGGGREVKLELEHLPPPGRLGNGMTLYAMWIIPVNGPPTLGSFLEYDEGSRKGHARATTPRQRFSVRVTVERNRRVSAPSSTVVAEHQIRR